MVSVEDAVIARLSKDHKEFEILVDPDKALEFKKGEKIDINDILAVSEIFKDSKKGERVSADDLFKAFNTTDIFKIAERIIREGEIQLTTEQRRRFAEEKKKQIATTISRQGIDPKTKLPHPVNRILNAMDQAHINIDPFKPAKDQIEHVLAKIQEILPISLERIEIAVKIPMEYAGRASSIVRDLGKISREEWKSDGWYCVMEIPAGIQSDIYKKLNDLTAGKVQVKILKEHKI